MKNYFILAAVFAIVIGATAHAQSWFAVNANITVNTAYAQATVQNTFGAPIYCQGYVYGQLFSGSQANNWMETWILPGAYGQVYLYATNPQMDPIVQGWADINCRY